MSWQEKARKYLQISEQFRLGDLPTEQSHPLTENLSALATNDLPKAIDTLLTVEKNALKILASKVFELEKLNEAIATTLEDGHRVFLCGCGATGRLSLSLETLWRQLVRSHEENPKLSERVISFMAGGDFALVRSIENFEDYPEYGARQLQDLGFKDGDLLISSTEGGETPFVIGATLEAARVSKNNPYFLYCNPDEVLTKKIERSRLVIENSNIHKISLPIGPMAICGSTRLQASTVLMLAIGSALFFYLTGKSPGAEIEEFFKFLKPEFFWGLQKLIQKESDWYSRHNLLLHSSQNYSITVITDLTERSPTFSLRGFENRHFAESEPAHHPKAPNQRALSWTYLWLPHTNNTVSSWEGTIHRPVRALSWDGFSDRYGQKMTLGFDFSKSTADWRRQQRHNVDHEVFFLDRDGQDIVFDVLGASHKIKAPDSLLLEHLLVKVALNISSNLIMGRLGRYEGNSMLWVKASNNKLVDRAIRFITNLLERDGIFQSYEAIAHALFKNLENLQADESIVLKTYKELRG